MRWRRSSHRQQKGGMLADDADVVLVHADPLTDLEHGFISFASTVAPCAAALAGWACATGFTNDEWNHVCNLYEGLVRDLVETVDLFASGGQLSCIELVDVAATGWATPASLDVESTWVEAELGTVRYGSTKRKTFPTADTRPFSGIQEALSFISLPVNQQPWMRRPEQASLALQF